MAQRKISKQPVRLRLYAVVLTSYPWATAVSGGTQTDSTAVEAERLSRAVESLLVLDLRALSEEQRRTSEAIFNELRDMKLKPAYLADADPNRALLDRRVVCELLGFEEGTYEAVRRLAAKWCAEPSVHGGKARPNDAKLVN